jgi:hypothetical protein
MHHPEGDRIMNQPSSRVAELIELHLAGEASHAQAEELRQEIASQPELAQHLFRGAYMHGVLQFSMSESAQTVLPTASTTGIMAAPATMPGAAPRRRLRTPSCPPVRSMVAQRKSVTGRTSWLAIAASLTVVASALIFSASQRPMPDVIGTLSDVDAGVTVVSGGGAAEPAAAGMPIFPGDVIRTPKSGKATLQFVVNDRLEATTLEIYAGTEAMLWQDQGAKRVNLTQGVLLCDVAIQPKGRPMVVITPHAEVEVLGTRFRVAASDETHLDVDQGSVRLLELMSGRKTIVAAGESTVAEGREPPSYLEIIETFDTADSAAANGWTGSGNRSNGRDFGWISGGLDSGGAAGGIFIRATDISYYADTSVGTLSRTGRLRLAGTLQLNNHNYDGAFYIGYFNPEEGFENFLGLRILEPTRGVESPFRCYAGVQYEEVSYMQVIELPQKTTLSFDLTWTGRPDGSGTLSGMVGGQNVSIAVAAGDGNFSAFGLLNGGIGGHNASWKTSNCYFDNLIYSSAAEKKSKR